jgi:hypothetical protein
VGDGWLETQNLARSQYRSPRRARLRGVIVVHTAESILDTIGPDTGAENVARYIVTRTTPGSYHDLVDSDSHVHLVDYDDEAWQDGTGSNPWALGLSFACRTTDWAAMAPATRAAFLDRGAQRAAEMARHIHRRTGILVPALRISRADSEAGVPGFVAHGDRDPGRRTDPGTRAPHLFPWADFLARYRHHAADLLGAGNRPPTEDDAMTPEQEHKVDRLLASNTRIEKALSTLAKGLAKVEGIAQTDYAAQLIDIAEQRETT